MRSEYDGLIDGQDAPKQDSNEYDAILDGESGDRKAALKGSMFVAGQRDPDRWAEVLRLSKKRDLPPPVVGRKFDEVSKQDAQELPESEYDAILDGAPKSAEFWSNPDNLAVTRDSLKEIAQLERKFKRIHGTLQPMTEGELNAAADRYVEAYKVHQPYGEYSSEAAKTRLRDVYLKMRHEDEAKIANMDQIGLGESLSVRLPFFSAITDAGRAIELFQAASAYREGTASPFQVDTLIETARLEEAAADRGTSILGTVGGIISELPAFAGELAATGGLYRAGSAGAQKYLQAQLANVLKGRLRGVVRKSLGTIAGAALQTPASSAARIAQETAHRMTPGIGVTQDEAGQLQAVVDDTGDNFMTALLKATGSQYVENLSERMGGMIEGPAGALKKAVFGRWLKLNPNKTVADFLNTVKKSTGWNGVLGEMFEERAGEVLKIPIEGYKPPTWDQLAAEAIAFAVPGGVKHLAHSTIARLTPKEEAARAVITSEHLKEVGDIVKAIPALQRSPEKLEEAIVAQTKGTPAEFLYAPAQEVTAYLQSQKDDAGVPIDPKSFAVDRLGVSPEAYDEAIVAKGPLKISAARYFVQVAPTSMATFFQGELSDAPDRMNLRETKEFLKAADEEANAGKPAAAHTPEQLLEEKRMNESVQKIQTFVETALDAAGFKQEAKTYAKLFSAGFKRLGARTKTDPYELFQRKPLTIERPGNAPVSAEGQVMEQAGLGENISDEQIDAQFAQIAEEVYSGKRIPRAPIPVARTPAVLKALGAQNLPIVMPASLLSEKREAHGISLEIFKDIPRQLRDPLMVFDSNTIPNAIVVLTEHLIGDKPVVVAVHLGRQEQGYQVNKVTSVHQRENKGDIGRWIDAGLLKYWDENRARTWLLTNGVNAPALATKPSSIPTVLGKSDVVKFEQAGQLGPRGRIRIGEGGISIDLLQTADRSTFLHEVGHFYLDLLGDLATAKDATEDLKADYQAILEWLGAKDRTAITTEHHEQWARGFEAYLMEGKAPSKALRTAFYRFRKWLTDVYRDLAGLNVQLTDSVRAVMDRMLASEEEIAEAKQDQAQQALFGEKPAWMSDAKWERYTKAIAEADQAAEEALLTKLMEQIRREEEPWWAAEKDRLRAEVSKELDQQPEYRKLHIMEFGQEPDGTPIAAVAGGLKLNREATKKQFGRFVYQSIPKKYLVTDGGYEPNAAADLLGFATGKDLVDLIVNTEARDKAVERITEERMQTMHGKTLTEEETRQEAVTALHNSDRSKILQMELEDLFASNPSVAKSLLRDLAKRPSNATSELAREMIGRKAIRSIDPRNYQKAERKAAKEAIAAFLKGDTQGAIAAKSTELMNHELYRAAVEAREAVSRAEDKFADMFADDEKLGKRRDMNYVLAARAILSRFWIGPGAGTADQNAQEHLEPIRKYDEDTHDALLGMVNAATQGAGPYRDVTFAAFMQMKETVDSLWTLSLRYRQMQIDGKIVDRDEVKRELQKRLDELKKPGGKEKYTQTAGKWEKAKLGLMGLRATLRRVESWVDAMDGGEPNGVFRKYIWTPISEAADNYRKAKRGETKKFVENLKKIEKGLTGEPIDAPELGKNGHRFRDKAELIAALLHSGNRASLESNQSKLVRGWGWGQVDQDGNVDYSAWDRFIRRMWKEGILIQDDYVFAQAVWDQNEALKPEAQRAFKNMYGHYFDEITADAIETPWGTYRGGYVPAIVDMDSAPDARRHLEKEELERNDNSFMFPTTGRGFTKGRVGGYAKRLSLNLKMVPSHIDKVLRFIHLEPRVKEVARLVTDSEFRDALDGFDQTIGNEMLVPWLQRVAQQVVEAPVKGATAKKFAAFFREVRKRSGMLIMATNVTNALQNYTGLILANTKVKAQYLRNALIRYARDPKGVSEAARAASTFMENRTDTEMAALLDQMNELILNPNAYDKFKDFAERNAHILQRITQNQMDNIVWAAAYEQAGAEWATEEEAVRTANAAVRQTQGAGAAEDISRIEAQTAFVRLFTQFIGYFNMQANLLGTEYVKLIRNGLGLKANSSRALHIYVVGFMLPTVIGAVIARMMSGRPPDDDDDDNYLDDAVGLFLGSQAKGLTALVPGGNIVNPFIFRATGGFTKDNWHDDRVSLSPAFSLLERAASSLKSVPKAIGGDGRTGTAIRDALTLIGGLSGLPTTTIARPAGYLADVAEGEAEPSGPFDFARGLVTGKSGSVK